MFYIRRDEFVYSATIGAYYHRRYIDRDIRSREKREIVRRLHMMTRRMCHKS